jgi:hypothetical protein
MLTKIISITDFEDDFVVPNDLTRSYSLQQKPSLKPGIISTLVSSTLGLGLAIKGWDGFSTQLLSKGPFMQAVSDAQQGHFNQIMELTINAAMAAPDNALMIAAGVILPIINIAGVITSSHQLNTFHAQRLSVANETYSVELEYLQKQLEQVQEETQHVDIMSMRQQIKRHKEGNPLALIEGDTLANIGDLLKTVSDQFTTSIKQIEHEEANRNLSALVKKQQAALQPLKNELEKLNALAQQQATQLSDNKSAFKELNDAITERDTRISRLAEDLSSADLKAEKLQKSLTAETHSKNSLIQQIDRDKKQHNQLVQELEKIQTINQKLTQTATTLTDKLDTITKERDDLLRRFQVIEQQFKTIPGSKPDTK